MSLEAYNLFLSHVKIWELVIATFTPITVALVGFFISQRIKLIEGEMQRSQSLIKKRVEIFDRLSASLNQIFCACFYVGDWNTTPIPEILKTKRACDQFFFCNIAFWSSDVMLAYGRFMEVCFHTYRGRGLHAVLLANVENYETGFAERWDPSWREYFVDSSERQAWLARFSSNKEISYSQEIVLPKFASLMEAFAQDLGSKTSSQGIIDVLGRKKS